MSKGIYKVEIILLKVIPIAIAGLYLINTILSYLGIDLAILSLIGGLSILPWIFLYVSSFAFHFCTYHRMFLYYIAACDILSYIDYYSCGTWLSDRNYFLLHIVTAGIFLFTIVYLKFKACRH